MAWTYTCESDRAVLRADSKEALADKMRQHLKEQHAQEMSHEQAMEAVNRGAKQAA